jgi:hypothetical protein
MSRVLAFSLFFMLIMPLLSEAQTITGPEVKLAGSDIFVSFSLNLEDRHIQQIRDGIDKELKLYIDLFRLWKVWPDEFVLGKFFTRTIKADPIKKEYVATSFDGNVLIERRFRSFESMLAWSISVKDLKLTNTRELEPGRYLVRITAESKVRKLPPLIGQFLIFISENEFRIKKDSGVFAIEGHSVITEGAK